MKSPLGDYQCQFSVDERKQMVAQVIQEARKAKNLTQKEVAEAVGVKLPTYSTYETGRSEPPIEILVRLSYLFGLSMDVLTQRDRTYMNSAELTEQIGQYKADVTKVEEVLKQRGEIDPATQKFLEGLKYILSATEQVSQNEKVRQQIDQIKK